jgi:acyl dehydratase
MSLTPSHFAPGHKFPTCAIAVSQPLIDAYAGLSGDFNPIHVEPEAGAASVFGTTIAHGCIPMEPLFQSILQGLGMQALPPGAAIRLRYRAPSRPGDVISAAAEVASDCMVGTRRVLDIRFVCVNQYSEHVMDGTSQIPL